MHAAARSASPTIDTTSDAFAELSNVKQPNPTGSSALHIASGTISFTDTDLTDRPVASAAFTSYTYHNAADATRDPAELDAIAAFLSDCGAAELVPLAAPAPVVAEPLLV